MALRSLKRPSLSRLYSTSPGDDGSAALSRALSYICCTGNEKQKRLQVKEAKGLDMVRRDWCGLAKDCGNFALDRILSGQPCEDVVDAIHAKLQEVSVPF